LGIVLPVVGLIAGSAIIAGSAGGTISGLASANEFQSDGTANHVNLVAGKATGIWMIDPTADVPCQVTDPTGAQVSLVTPSASQNVNNYGLYVSFTPPVSGTYTVTCTGASYPWGSVVDPYKVAPLLSTGRLTGGIVAGILIIVILFLGGIALLIVTIIRRSNWDSKYRAQATAMYPVYPPTYPPHPPQ